MQQYPPEPEQPSAGQPAPFSQQPAMTYQLYPGIPLMPPPRKPRRWPWIVGLVVVFFFGFFFGVGVGSASSTATPRESPAQAGQPTQKPTQAPAQKKWTTTHTFTGNGSKKTAAFAVPDNWKIVWTCRGDFTSGVLAILVYNSDNTFRDSGTSTTCKSGKITSDSTEEYQAGNIYLDVNAIGDWTIAIQELK